VFIIALVYFVIDSVRKRLDKPSYSITQTPLFEPGVNSVV